MSYIARFLIISVSTLAGICLFRAHFMFQPKESPRSWLDSGHNHKYISIGENPMILERFKKALNIATVSYKPHVYDADKMLEFINHIESSKYNDQLVTMLS